MKTQEYVIGLISGVVLCAMVFLLMGFTKGELDDKKVIYVKIVNGAFEEIPVNLNIDD